MRSLFFPSRLTDFRVLAVVEASHAQKRVKHVKRLLLVDHVVRRDPKQVLGAGQRHVERAAGAQDAGASVGPLRRLEHVVDDVVVLLHVHGIELLLGVRVLPSHGGMAIFKCSLRFRALPGVFALQGWCCSH